MKGLIVKDFALMFQRKRSFILIALCGLVMSFSVDGSFIVGWLIVIGSIFTLSTIAYDEHDNCYPFLMTLPISRKGYAVEKYVFGAICALIFWVFGVLFYILTAAVRGTALNMPEEIPALLIVIMIPFLILDFSIPLNLKYGSEKGRIYMLVFWGALFAVGFLLSRILSPEGDVQLASGAVSTAAVLGIAAVATIVLTVLSVMWSIRIMTKKEF